MEAAENSSMMTDIEMLAIRSAQKGDELAWRKLFDWHFEAVYRYCSNLTYGQQDFAEDITQEAFMIAARHINKFNPQHATFRAWLLGIAKNSFMKLKSKEFRHQKYKEELLSRSCEKMDGSSLQLLVDEALALLPEHYRLVLEAKYLKGLTVNQIAEIHRLSLKATESLLVRAKKKFEEVYTQIGD